MAKFPRLTIEQVRRALTFSQPFLEFFEDEDSIFAKGWYVVSDGAHADGPVWKFEVLCAFSRGYPKQEPIVLEIGEAIERIADRHMYTNGVCCLCVWEEWLAKSSDTSFQSFCDGPLHNFFLSQVIFEQTGKWPFDERSHGAKGVAEGIASVLGFEVTAAQANRYASAVGAKELKGHWMCPCGSGDKLRNCHLEQVQSLRAKIGRGPANALQSRLRDAMKQERLAS